MLMPGKVCHFLHRSCLIVLSTDLQQCYPAATNISQTIVQERSTGLFASPGSPYTEVQSSGSSDAGDVVLCMPDSIKENMKPVKKEGSKTMAELQVSWEQYANSAKRAACKYTFNLFHLLCHKWCLQ